MGFLRTPSALGKEGGFLVSLCLPYLKEWIALWVSRKFLAALPFLNSCVHVCVCVSMRECVCVGV